MEGRRFTYSGSMKISRTDMALLRAGKKRCTVRLGTASVAGSEIVMTDGRTSVPVRILNVDTSRHLSELTDQDAIDEGFENKEELWKDLRHFYPRATDNDSVTVIHFECLNSSPTLFEK
jgi:hypothetical protein